ncbi:hypothetical protein ACN6MY_13820 [Peribacillus sp. B-H-3]|jgi:hypothetical protein|uniref:hypothetical protein n=1 Tax=Peribacillus sp. B-H-3 TaxID=3400420 RepID=UPI003B026FDA
MAAAFSEHGIHVRRTLLHLFRISQQNMKPYQQEAHMESSSKKKSEQAKILGMQLIDDRNNPLLN